MRNIKNVYDLIFENYYPLIAGTKKPNVKEVNKANSIDYKTIEELSDFGATLKPDTVMVDIDDVVQANKVKGIIEALNVNCVIIQTTKGMHFHFKAIDRINCNKNDYYTPIGIKTETKFAHQNTITPVKLNGEHRKIIYFKERLDQLPVWLYPISRKEYADFKSMDEHDGRNNTLFSYILTLQQQGLSKEEIKTVLSIINQFILKKPITQKEFEIITRDEAFKKGVFFKGKSFDHSNFARVILGNNHIYRIGEMLYIYKDGIYVNDKRALVQAMIREFDGIKVSQQNEVLARLDAIAPLVELSEPNKIPLSNGLYNIETRQLEELTYNYISVNKIPVAYIENAYDPQLDKALNDICCNDKNLRLVIEEMFGASIYRSNEFNKLFILSGCGSNGKSTILDLLKSMLGKENVSSIPLQDFSKTFRSYQIMNKLTNIGDDLDKASVKDTGVLKKLVTGEDVLVERKGRDPYVINSYATLFFSSNSPVLVDDTSDGFKRRVMNIPFNAKFVKGVNADYSIITKCRNGDTSFLEYMLRLSIEGLHRLIENGDYTKCAAIDKANREYEEINNSVLAFLNSLNSYEDILYNRETNENTTAEVYKRYACWFIEENDRKCDKSKAAFISEVKNITGFKVGTSRVKSEFLKPGDKDRVSVFKK